MTFEDIYGECEFLAQDDYMIGLVKATQAIL